MRVERTAKPSRTFKTRRCEICSCSARGKRLCAPCREAIARLAWVWPHLSAAERGLLHFTAMQQEQLAAAAAASSGT